MKNRIAAATVIGSLIAAACLIWEQQSSAAFHVNHVVTVRDSNGVHATPFGRRLRYPDI
jgi:hypothetical protein